MWVNKKKYPYIVDSKIVKRDFIIAEGYTLAYGFLHNDDKINPFGRSLYAPIFYLFKIHRNHPMSIISTSQGHVNIYPYNEIKSRKPRMPASVYDDKKEYDLSTFMIVPFKTNEGSFGSWERFVVENGFTPNKENSSLPENLKSNKQDITLLYANHGTSTNSQDNLPRVSEVMPSQVINHLFAWLHDSKEIFSHDKTFNQKLEGIIDISLDNSRGFVWKLADLLEKRYNTRLKFPDKF